MALTRFSDDDCRIQKYLEESVAVGNYALNVPGNGLAPYYMNDPFVKIQKWGANLSENQVDLENDLRGQTRLLNRDSVKDNNYLDYVNNKGLYRPNFYPVYETEITGQSRATNPAFTLREFNYLTEKDAPNNFKYLFMDPQENVGLTFNNNISTRIVEKDYYSVEARTDIY